MNALAECRTLTVTCMYACIAVQGVHPRVSNINSTTSTPKGVTVAPFSNNVHSSHWRKNQGGWGGNCPPSHKIGGAEPP